MKKILLTQGKIALVDDEDYKRLSKFKWNYEGTGGSNYAKRSVRVQGLQNQKTIRMCCEILQTNELIDHKDTNGLNYQKSNLRLCTSAQNAQNRKKPKMKTSSKYKGISATYYKSVYSDYLSITWVANIGFTNIFGRSVQKYLGRFKVEEEAAKAYDEAAREHFGDFARLNFPKEGEQSCL